MKSKFDYVCACGKELPCPEHTKGTVAGEKPGLTEADMEAILAPAFTGEKLSDQANGDQLSDYRDNGTEIVDGKELVTPNTGQTFEEVLDFELQAVLDFELEHAYADRPRDTMWQIDRHVEIYQAARKKLLAAHEADKQAAVRAARQQGWLGALKWARTQYDEMEGRQSQADKDVTWRGWKWIRNRLTDEIERITGDRVGNQIDATPPALDQTTEGTEA